jgi:hypothetical protein
VSRRGVLTALAHEVGPLTLPYLADCLTFAHIRWIERCAERIMAGEPELGHMAAVQHAFELWSVLTALDPVQAAEAYVQRELVI